MTTQNGPLILESSRICTILLQDLMKRGVCQCGVEMLLASEYRAGPKCVPQLFVITKDHKVHMLNSIQMSQRVMYCLQASTSQWLT